MSSSTRGTTRKVLGSLAVIGTAAAVAGLGTFGTFTDSTTPITTQVASGTVSINVSEPVTIPATTAGFLPGDSLTRPLTLVNDGNSPLSSVSLGVTAPVGSVLSTDKVNGLQLALRSCSVPWTQNGVATTCGGTESLVHSGPAVGDRAVTGAASLNPGGVDHLAVTLSLPTTAGNEFQGKTSTLALTFSGIQRAATTR